jgi:ferric-dicitrate binding protein FerR (iron transport regulator)
MMDRNILHKFHKGLASDEEKKAVKQWLESDPRHEETFRQEREWLNLLILSVSPPDFGSAAKKPPALRRFFREALKIAAAIALTLVGSVYFYTEKMEAIRLAIHTVTVPPGQRATILLPDSTRVWLNARSEIKYPAFFTSRRRSVQLDGEAYFEVSRNEQAPFTVHTDKCDIEVLGTTFDVDAYSDSEHFSVALIEGSVKVTSSDNPEQTVTLSPRHKVDYANGLLLTGLIDDFDAYRWRDGLICFKDADFIELMRRLEKCYDTRIIIEDDKFTNHVISGKLRISDGIDNALRILQKEAKYTFIRDSEDAVIYIKKQ